MPPLRRYQHAPITEAILDLRVGFPEEVAPDAFSVSQDRVRGTYSSCEGLVAGSITVQLGQLGGPSPLGTSQQHSGFVFRSQDGVRVFQATVNGFTFNHLQPYDRWETFRDEARQLWDIYREAVNPVTV